MGKIDWGQWAMGLAAAFLGGGSGAVSNAFGNMIIAPDQFNLQHPGKLFESMVIMFFFSGAIAFFAKLHTTPIPTVVTTVTTTVLAKEDPPSIVKTTVTETHTDAPNAEKK